MSIFFSKKNPKMCTVKRNLVLPTVVRIHSFHQSLKLPFFSEDWAEESCYPSLTT